MHEFHILAISFLDIDKAYDLVQNKLVKWLHNLALLLPNIFIASIVLVFGLFIARWLRNLCEKLFYKVSPTKALNNLLSSTIYFLLIGITLFSVLSILKLDKTVTTILASAGIVGLALAFAFQDIAANFISGIFISFRRPLHVGDIVKIKNYMGKVEDINLRDTVLRTFQGQMVIIPNKEVFQNPIENYSLLGKRRMDLTVGVSYGEDLRRVQEITLLAVRGIEGLTDPEETTLFFMEFGGSSINFVLRMWVKSPEQPQYLYVNSEAVIRIKEAFDKNNIMIPFPITTLDFGIKGGKALSEIAINLEGRQD